MSDWNPSLYLHFAAERSRPAVELLARVSLENIEYIADLGCGPGNSTALLHQRWPAARITGIDSSPAMIAEARSALPDCLFVEADIRNWQPEQALDLIFANASLQWLPDHYELFPHLVSLLSPLGVLAVQMPDNWLEPTHVLMREVAWEQNYPDVTGSDRERTAAFSYALPSDAGRAISPPGERTDIAGISASVYCCPPYGVIITSAGNGDREEFSLEFLLHRSSVTGQFQ